MVLICQRENTFVNLKSNIALWYNKGHNFWKSVSTWNMFMQHNVYPLCTYCPYCPPRRLGLAILYCKSELGTKYAAKKYSPSPSLIHVITFHLTNFVKLPVHWQHAVLSWDKDWQFHGCQSTQILQKSNSSLGPDPHHRALCQEDSAINHSWIY